MHATGTPFVLLMIGHGSSCCEVSRHRCRLALHHVAFKPGAIANLLRVCVLQRSATHAVASMYLFSVDESAVGFVVVSREVS